MKYEVIREIFNLCSGNQMRDVYVDELEIPDIDAASPSSNNRNGSCGRQTNDQIQETDAPLFHGSETGA